MSITIDLPRKTEKELRRRADRHGQEIGAYVRDLLEREVEFSFEELVRPIHEQSEKLGLTENDIEEMVDTELAEVRRETPLSSR